MTKIAYTIAEAAEQVSVSPSFIQRAVRDGELTAHYLNGTTPRILHDDLVAYAASAPTGKRRAA